MIRFTRTLSFLALALASVVALASYTTTTLFTSTSADTTGPSISNDGNVIAYLADNGAHLKLKVGSSSAITINGSWVPCSRPYVNRDGTAVSFYGRYGGGGSSYPLVYIISSATLSSPTTVSGTTDPTGETNDPSLTILSGTDHNAPALSNTDSSGNIYCCWADLRSAPPGGLGGSGTFYHYLVWWQVGTSAATVFSTVSNVDTANPSLTSNGQYVAFGANGQIYYDNTPLGTAMTAELISQNNAGTTGNGNSDNPSVNGDGSFVAYDSAATNLIASDNNGSRDIFVRDRNANTTSRPYVDTTVAGGAVFNDSVHPSFSADGTWLGFHSANPQVRVDAGCTNLDGKTIHNGPYAMIVHFGTSTTLELVSTKSGSSTIAHAGTYTSVGDGGIIAFDSNDNGICTGDATGHSNVYLKTGHY